MFNLLIKANGWENGGDAMPEGRVLEHTDPHLIQKYKPEGQLNLLALASLPTLFLEEGRDDEVARVGTITRARISGRDIALEYAYDSAVPPLTNYMLKSIALDLDIKNEFEFHRTHWAVKDVDLFRVLFRNMQPRRKQPKVFQLADPEIIDSSSMSAMMPFHPSFDAVYATLRNTAEEVGFQCQRADDIWENPSVIQDVVTLIDQSSVVICDCTGRNPNVFYEIGIAHTLGREVILITQAETDIPFDLQHLRYVKYLNNGEGLNALQARLKPRLADLA